MEKTRKHRKLKTEFLLNTLISIILLFVVVLTIVVGLNVKMYRDEIYFKNGLVSDSLISQLDEHSKNQVRIMENFSYYYEADTDIDKDLMDERLQMLLSYDEMFLRVQVVDAKGILTHTTSNDKSNLGLDLSNQPYITVLNQSGEYFYSNSFFSKDYNRVMSSLSYKTDLNYYIVFLDLGHFADHINRLPIKDQLEYLLLDHNGTIVSSSITELAETRSRFSFYKKSKKLMNDFNYVTIKDKKYLINDSLSNYMNWTIIILNDSNEILKPIYFMIIISIGISATMIIIIIVFQNRRINYIVSKITELNSNLKLIRKGVYDLVFSDTQFDEFYELETHFVKSTEVIQLREEEINSLNINLEYIVEQRTSELLDKNDELIALIAELQNTQEMLVESEKSASFSRLIAGIAHEVNTPIGVCITMSSYLITASQKLEKAYNNNELTKTNFKKYVNKIIDISDLLLENLMKSGDLITSFKTAANNNFTFDLLEYNLFELAINLVKSLKTQIKNKNITIDVNIEKDLILSSFPSAMSQILTNLISNAINHGFKGRNEGVITITAIKDHHNVVLTVEDNGNGIPDDIGGVIFEPFYTTNRADGGMGLGLSITQNLVVSKLMGSLKIDSVVNQHTKFTISLPLNHLKE